MCTLPRPCLFPFRAPATTDPYTLSLHDALPISGGSTTTRRRRRPRVGFAGIGWIGKNRLNAIRKADIIELVAVADPHSEALAGVSRELPGVILHDRFESLLDEDLDGVVIATPSALHAQQAVQALNRGVAVVW